MPDALWSTVRAGTARSIIAGERSRDRAPINYEIELSENWKRSANDPTWTCTNHSSFNCHVSVLGRLKVRLLQLSTALPWLWHRNNNTYANMHTFVSEYVSRRNFCSRDSLADVADRTVIQPFARPERVEWTEHMGGLRSGLRQSSPQSSSATVIPGYW